MLLNASSWPQEEEEEEEEVVVVVEGEEKVESAQQLDLVRTYADVC